MERTPKDKKPQLPETPFRVNFTDLAVLLALAVKGANHPRVGFEDAEIPLDKLTKILNSHSVKLKQETLESLLWSANLMDEEGQFWSAKKGESFTVFTRRLLTEAGKKDHYFDARYNLIRKKSY
jgi:hypothetical protein